MKLFIDDIEIKTVIKGLTIEGSVELVSRSCSFSYVYDSENKLYKKYKAKINSIVTIKNDKGKNIYKGQIVFIGADKNKKLVNIKVQDMTYLHLSKKIAGRFKGPLILAIKTLISKYKNINKINKFLKKEINVLSLGNFTVIDIIYSALSKIYDEFKIHSDGDGSFEILIPSISDSRATLVLGKDIFNASFVSKGRKNASYIMAFDNEDVVSGSVVKIVDETGKKAGYFLVEADRHIYSDINYMELELKERNFVS